MTAQQINSILDEHNLNNFTYDSTETNITHTEIAQFETFMHQCKNTVDDTYLFIIEFNNQYSIIKK